jgi:GNAT superfamily N-acetyltransferase
MTKYEYFDTFPKRFRSTVKQALKREFNFDDSLKESSFLATQAFFNEQGEKKEYLCGFLCMQHQKITWLFTLKRFRRRGIAKRLLMMAIDRFKGPIYLNSVKECVPIALYESLGFAQCASNSDIPLSPDLVPMVRPWSDFPNLKRNE